MGHVRRREKRRLVARRPEEGGDFPQPEDGALKGFRLGQLGRLARGEFFELGPDVAEITLEVFLHRTGFAIPFGTLVAGWRETIVSAAEKVFPERQFHQGGPNRPARIT